MASLADRVDAMLGPGFGDLQAVEALFAEIESAVLQRESLVFVPSLS